MKNHARPQPEVIFAATMPSTRGEVRVALEIVGRGLAMKVRRAGKRPKHFPVPGDISAFDVPYWFSSVLRTIAPSIDGKMLAKCEASVRVRVPSKGGLISICVGPKSDFHQCKILHIDPTTVLMGQHGSTLAISAPIQGLRFTKGSLLAVWTIIFRTASKLRALALQKRLLEPGDKLVSLDGEIEGIMAFNSRHWASAGIPATEVVKFAAEQDIPLRQEESEGPSLVFRVKGT